LQDPLVPHEAAPLSEQATEQQMPPMQLPLVHWPFAVQAPPLATSELHEPPLQKWPATQSAFVVQEVLQTVPPHLNRPQLVLAPATLHAPLPLQVFGAVSVLELAPSLHWPTPHTVPVG